MVGASLALSIDIQLLVEGPVTMKSAPELNT